MKFRSALLACASLFVCVPAIAAESGTIVADSRLIADAKAFGAREAVIRPDLSADGSRVIYVTPSGGRGSTAVIGNLDTGQFNQVVSGTGAPDILRWCAFASSSRAVCQITGTTLNSVSNEPIGFTRLLSVNNDGSEPKSLGQTDSFYDAWIRQFDASIVDRLDGTDNKMLIQRQYVPEEGKLGTRLVRTKQGLGVDRVDVKSLASQTVEEPRDGASGYVSDGQGHIRLMSVPDVSWLTGHWSGRESYLYRTPNSNDWKQLIETDYKDFQPLAVDGEANVVYALKKKNGRYALYAISLDGSLAEKLIASNPHVDIDDVVRFGDGQRVIGYTYSEDKGTVVYFDPEFKALSEALEKALNEPMVDFVDSSHDGRKLLIHAGSDRDPGRYYTFDRDKKALTPAMLDRPELEGRQLASVKPISIQAPDGVTIPAYLTLPPGKDPKNLSAVILPHGGPSARDYWGFDWLSQFLAARGYAVLQPEYRGSAGFGDAWLNENGFKNWRTSIGDITASAKWLAAQGIANPDREAILGWSYGGYAALQSAATEPALYKAVIAIAPVTDLAMLKADYANFSNASLVAQEIGEGPHVAEGSPLQHAKNIIVPVLLFHGNTDANVSISHSIKMNAALKSAGRESQLFTFQGLDHQLDDSEVRAQMLVRIGQLLDQTIGH
jgi:dipeptidyl aminopeptidase/acylaminoacyl peptidase